MSKQSTRGNLPLALVIFFLGMTSCALAQTKKIDSLLDALQKEKREVAKIPILRGLSKSFTTVDPDKKYVYAKQMLKIASKHKIDSIIAVAYLDMATVFGIKTHYDSSMYYFSKGLALSKENNLPSHLARAYVGIGYTFDRLDNPKAAVENYKLALVILKKINLKRGLNQTYINLGSIYYDMGDHKIADTYFRQALKIAEESKDQAAIAQGYFNIGGTSKKLGNEKKAEEYYIKSLKIREKMNDLNGIALANWGLGELYADQDEFAKAQKFLDIALKNNRTLQNKYQEAAVLLTIGENYLKISDYKKAEENATLAYENGKIMNSKVVLLMSLALLADINAKNEKFKKAYQYQAESIVFRDSLNIEKVRNEFIYTDFQRIRSDNDLLEKNNEAISSKNLIYKRAIYTISGLLLLVVLLLFLYFRKIKQKSKINKILAVQTKEIRLINAELESVNEELQVQNVLTNKQNQELERINAVKNKFFSIVSHDLRSPIATLKMLFSSYSSGYLTREEMDLLLKQLEENIFTTADFLDNLLEWSKSQLEGMIVSPELCQIETLTDGNLKILQAQIIEKNLIVTNNINKNCLAFADKNMINVVFRNILSNSIKFCKEGDSIILECTIKNESVVISINDSGIGMNFAEQKKIFQLEHTVSKGTSGEKGHHIGLVLCKDMVEQNNGKIWFESEVGSGTTFFIELPLGAV